MTTITIRIAADQVESLDRLFLIARECFPNDKVVLAQAGEFVVEVDMERADYLLDILSLGVQTGGFEPFPDVRNHRADQLPLGIREP